MPSCIDWILNVYAGGRRNSVVLIALVIRQALPVEEFATTLLLVQLAAISLLVLARLEFCTLTLVKSEGLLEPAESTALLLDGLVSLLGMCCNIAEHAHAHS